MSIFQNLIYFLFLFCKIIYIIHFHKFTDFNLKNNNGKLEMFTTFTNAIIVWGFWVKYVSFYIFFHFLNVLVLINLYYSIFIACIEVTNLTTTIIGVFLGFFYIIPYLIRIQKNPKISYAFLRT